MSKFRQFQGSARTAFPLDLSKHERVKKMLKELAVSLKESPKDSDDLLERISTLLLDEIKIPERLDTQHPTAIKGALREIVLEYLSTQAVIVDVQNEVEEEIPIGLKEGARILGIALPTMYAKVARREFTSYRKGKKVYLFRSELLEYLKSGKRRSVEEITNSNYTR